LFAIGSILSRLNYEAYRLWQIKQQGKQKAKRADLFDE
jgi:hypothetical protein